MSKQRLDNAKLTVVHTQEVVRNRTLPPTIGEKTTSVHICGYLFLWVLEEILKQAPNLKVLRVIPRELHRLHKYSHLKLLNEHGVEVIVGHQKPSAAWHAERRVPQGYEAQRQYLKNLAGPQKELFDELLKYGLKYARMISRYFCLNGEAYVTFGNLAVGFGYALHASYAHDVIHGVLHYLAPRSDSTKAAKQKAVALKAHVARIRLREAKRERMRGYTQGLGIATLPANLKPAQYALFEKVLRAHQSGRLESALKEKDSRALCIVKERWGLKDGVVRTHKEMGDIYGVSRQRAQQIEQFALELVGIR